jgi:hypothetical protein
MQSSDPGRIGEGYAAGEPRHTLCSYARVLSIGTIGALFRACHRHAQHDRALLEMAQLMTSAITAVPRDLLDPRSVGMPKFRDALRSASTRAANAFLISRSRRPCAHRPAMACQRLVGQLRPFERPASNEVSPDAVSEPGAARLISSSNSGTPECIAEETIAIALRRACQETTSCWGALASARDVSAGDAAIACGDAWYDAAYNAKPSMKKARIDDGHSVVSWRSNRAGITSAPSSLGVRFNPSCPISRLSRGSTGNERLGRSYSLVILFAV